MLKLEGQSKSSVPCKTLCQLINNRIQGFVDTALWEKQAGFRQGRDCSDQTFVLRNIIEHCEEWQKFVVLTFVDFRRAFNCVHRESMWIVLEIYGIPRKFISLIQNTYDGSESCVMVGLDHTDWFILATGVRQGYVLSPLLFNILLEFVLWKIDTIECGFQWKCAERLWDLDYVNAICLLVSDVDKMQRMVDTLVTEGKKIGLTNNSAKTELMKIRVDQPQSMSIGDYILKEVNSFVYLGSRLCSNGDKRSEIKPRLGKASYAFNFLSKVRKEDRLSPATRLKLFNAIVASALLYCCVSWKRLQGIEERVRRFESICSRKVMKLKWHQHVSKKELRQRTGQQSVVEKLKIAR